MKKKYIIAILCLIAFIITTALVVTNNTNTLDDFIYEWVYEKTHNDILDLFFTHFTKIGNTIPTIILTFILVIIFKEKDRMLIGSNLILTVGVNQLLKRIIQRPRPPLERRLVKQGGYSYPSGHTMVSLAIYGILIYLAMKKIKNKKLKILTVVFLTIMILLIGISRIYVGVHYPSDVLGGYFCSIVLIIIDITVVNHFIKGE